MYLTPNRMFSYKSYINPNTKIFLIQLNQLYLIFFMEIPDHTIDFPAMKTLQSPAYHQEESVFYSIQELSSIIIKRQPSEKDQCFKQSPNQQYVQTFKPIIRNYIYKKTKNVSWENRYFILTKNRIVYYTKQDLLELKGCFNLQSLLEYRLQAICQWPQIRLSITLQSQQSETKNLLKLLFSNEAVYKQWSKALAKVIQNLSKSDLTDYPRIPKDALLDNAVYFKNHFWNKLLITKEEFKSYANQLDIIFFKTTGPFAYMNRTIMRSDFDHVGLLFRDENNQINIFEAISSRGVWTVNWEDFLESYSSLYEEISYRKLILPDNYQISMKNLEVYLNKLIGKKYELSFSKLFSNFQIDNKEVDKQNSTFFCSELIANIYMKFNLLKAGNCHSYWPKTFCQNIILQNGAILGPIMKIQL